jgi:hypothetical protein
MEKGKMINSWTGSSCPSTRKTQGKFIQIRAVKAIARNGVTMRLTLMSDEPLQL